MNKPKQNVDWNSPPRNSNGTVKGNTQHDLGITLSDNPWNKFPNYEKYKNLKKVIETRQLLIESLKQQDINIDRLKSIIYEFLVYKNKHFEIKDKTWGFRAKTWYEQARNKIEEYCESNWFKVSTNPGWCGINTNPNNKINTDVDLKIYTSIPINSYTFLQYIPRLANYLKLLSQKSGDSISIKFPYSFTAFAFHNDSLVIHFNRQENTNEIMFIIKKWLQEFNIPEQIRELNRARFAGDKWWKSFSQLLSTNITNWLLQNRWKIDDETLVELAIHYTIQFAQKGPRIIS